VEYNNSNTTSVSKLSNGGQLALLFYKQVASCRLMGVGPVLVRSVIIRMVADAGTLLTCSLPGTVLAETNLFPH
jgi:hypothetical protein